MQRVAVHVAKNGDGLNAEFAAGAQDADGNFAAIGNQDFLEHKFEMQLNFSMRVAGPN